MIHKLILLQIDFQLWRCKNYENGCITDHDIQGGSN